MDYLAEFGMSSIHGILNIIEAGRIKRLREEAGITSVGGYQGIEKIGIPHKYDHIEIGGKYLTCILEDRKTVYTREGKLLFECSDFKYYKQEMFLVGNKKDTKKIKGNVSDDFGYALYNNDTKLTEPIFKPYGMSHDFNESGFVAVGILGNFGKQVVINKSGDIVLESKSSFDCLYLKGIICINNRDYINLLTGNIICEKGYGSGMETADFMFVQVDSNCVYQINKNNGDFIIHGAEKVVEKPKAIAPKAILPPEPTVPKQRRNDLCSCGSGKKFKNCCIK